MATARGWRRARVSQARFWALGARRLLNYPDVPEVELGYVAAFVALGFAHQFVAGDIKSFHRRGDIVARSDCPVAPAVIARWHERLRPARNAILHLGERPKPNREIRTAFSPGSVNLAVWQGRPPKKIDSIARAELLALFDLLDPWLEKHDKRLAALP